MGFSRFSWHSSSGAKLVPEFTPRICGCTEKDLSLDRRFVGGTLSILGASFSLTVFVVSCLGSSDLTSAKTIYWQPMLSLFHAEARLQPGRRCQSLFEGEFLMSFPIRAHLRGAVSLVLLYSIGCLSWAPLAPVHAAKKNAKLSTSPSQPLPKAPHRPNEVLVRFRPGASQAQRDILAAGQGARLEKETQGRLVLGSIRTIRSRGGC